MLERTSNPARRFLRDLAIRCIVFWRLRAFDEQRPWPERREANEAGDAVWRTAVNCRLLHPLERPWLAFN